jgi:subtilisin family serine protease
MRHLYLLLILSIFIGCDSGQSVNAQTVKNTVLSQDESINESSVIGSLGNKELYFTTTITKEGNDYLLHYEDSFSTLEQSSTLLYDLVKNGEITVIAPTDSLIKLTNIQTIGNSIVGIYQSEATTQEAYVEVMKTLLARSDVIAVEPNYRQTVEATTLNVNDPQKNQLWGLEKIDADLAWKVNAGSKNSVVAVIDTGIDYNHIDLVSNIWRNSDEIAGNRVDDDGNGLIDDIRGFDFANFDTNPMDDHGHGTHVSGTIGASGNNGIGIVGVSQNVSLMPIKVLGADGSGDSLGVFYAMVYAMQNGADIMNMSLGGYGFSFLNYVAAYWANQEGVILVAAAGNERNNNDSRANYPASFGFDNIISVAASGESDSLASFSNYGARSVDIVAPGADIYSTVPNNGYTYSSGTSMAAPHIAGACALLLSQKSMSISELKTLLFSTAVSNSSYSGKIVLGSGRVDLGSAMQTLAPVVIPDEVTTTPIEGTQDENSSKLENLDDTNSTTTPSTSDGQNSTKENRIDATTSNEILSVTPANHSEDISKDVELAVTLKRGLSDQEIKTINAKIKPKGGQYLKVEKHFENATLYFNSTLSLHSRTNYIAEITIELENGDKLSYNWAFDTK